MSEKYIDYYGNEQEYTKEQIACIEYMGDKVLAIKGLAGSGKSTALVGIARKFINEKKEFKIGFFTYQTTLVSSTKELLSLNCSQTNNFFIGTIDRYIYEIYNRLVKEGKAPKKKKILFDDDEKYRLQIVKKALEEHKQKYGAHRFHKLSEEFWLKEFDWMKQRNVWDDNMSYYLALPRKGRGGVKGDAVKMKIAERSVAYQIFQTYCSILKRMEQADWVDQTLFLVRNPQLIPKDMIFDYLLLDEAQDLTTVQMFAVVQLFKENMVMALDANQKIFNRFWTAKSLNISLSTKALPKTLRTTQKIETLAESMRIKNDDILLDDDRAERVLPDAEGDNLPQIVHLENALAEQKYVTKYIKQYQSSMPKATIGVITANRWQRNKYSEWFTNANIRHEIISRDSTFSVGKPGVKIVTAYGAKGLEFDCVIIPMFAEGYFPPTYKEGNAVTYDEFLIKKRNLVYVAMTRARHDLVITYWGYKGSRFLGELNRNMYEFIGDSIEGTYHISTNSEPIEYQNTNTETNIANSPNANTTATKGESSLYAFLKSKGLEVIDNRDKTGELWVVGGKEILPLLNESKSLFKALWNVAAKGNALTAYRPAWRTKCKR